MSAEDLLRVSVRLPPAFHAEAESYAASLGVSFNALVAFALRQYLDRAKFETAQPAQPAPAAQPKPMQPAPATSPANSVVPLANAARPSRVPKVGKHQRCPCGSTKPYGKCCGSLS